MTKTADVLAECHPIRNIFMYSHKFFLASIPPNYTIFGSGKFLEHQISRKISIFLMSSAHPFSKDQNTKRCNSCVMGCNGA